jgi:hypothetical protein
MIRTHHFATDCGSPARRIVTIRAPVAGTSTSREWAFVRRDIPDERRRNRIFERATTARLYFG